MSEAPQDALRAADTPREEPSSEPSAFRGHSDARRGPAPVTPMQPSPTAPAPAAPAGSPAGNNAAANGAAPPKSKSKARKILGVIVLLGLGAAGWWGYHYWTVGRFHVETDDAYVQADITHLSAKVSGYVSALPVEENTAVKAGDLIAKIDDSDYKVALDSAKAKVDSARATVARIGSQINAQEALIDQAKAQVASADAELTRATNDFNRAQTLMKGPAGMQKTLDDATADLSKAKAALLSAKAQVASAEGQRDVLVAQKLEAERQLASDETAVRQAELDLGHTEIRAPVDGVFGNKAVNLGGYVQPGTRIGALVPSGAYYVEANFKETQLGAIKPGLQATVSVDALDGNALHGTVKSISPGSGATFSLLPPDNATGNFTKITQRVPVRIEITPSDETNAMLRPGLSVIVTVDTREGEAGAANAAPAPAKPTP